MRILGYLILCIRRFQFWMVSVLDVFNFGRFQFQMVSVLDVFDFRRFQFRTFSNKVFFQNVLFENVQNRKRLKPKTS